jgi:hypothetical protein
MRKWLRWLGLGVVGMMVAGCALQIQPPQAGGTAPVRSATGVSYLGLLTYPTGTDVLGTELGGLSAIAFAPTTNRFYFLSDDRAEHGPVRLYQATVALEDGRLAEGDVAWEAVVELLDRGDVPFDRGSIDPEGLAYTGSSFWVASEGNGTRVPPIPPALIEFAPDGAWLADLPIPPSFLPGPESGVRNNLAFEALALTPDGTTLFVGLENALLQDGPAADVGQTSGARIIAYDLAAGKVQQTWVYVVEAVPIPPNPPSASRDNGLVEFALLEVGPDGVELLALERSYAQGVGVTARIYRVTLPDAAPREDVWSLSDLAPEELAARTATKELLVDVGGFGLLPDNLEGMALGPRLEDGRQTLLLVSDNNFSPGQRTQILAFALPGE